MPMCFVIQPFDDDGKFDRRYSETFEPALQDAGLEPYRVDKDHSAEVPIEEIERKIRDAAICLAEISTDNPNVWYELGYALACEKRVIMICSDERTGQLPFDIQHRRIIMYRTESVGDFGKLRADICGRARAIMDHQVRDEEARKQEVRKQEVRKDVGESAHRDLNETYMRFLRIAANKMPIEGDSISLDELKVATSQSGMSGIDFGLVFRRLEKDRFVERRMSFLNNRLLEAVALTEVCWNWINENETLFRETGDPFTFDSSPGDD